MTAQIVRRALAAAALAAAATGVAASGAASGAASTGTTAAAEICYFRQLPGAGTVIYCVPRTPLSQNDCAVSIGSCDGGCTVNVGDCGQTGSCLVNVGSCGDDSLIGL